MLLPYQLILDKFRILYKSTNIQDKESENNWSEYEIYQRLFLTTRKAINHERKFMPADILNWYISSKGA